MTTFASNVSVGHGDDSKGLGRIAALVDAAAAKVMNSTPHPPQRPFNMSLKRPFNMSLNNSSFATKSSSRYTMNGAVIFLHGESQTAAEYRNTISGISGLEDMLIQNGFMPLFPDAELQQEGTSTEYRALWFVNSATDVDSDGKRTTEPDWSIQRAYGTIIEPAINRMRDNYEVPVHKVIVGGFSRGGDMGLQMLRLNPDIGGFFSVAGYLPDTSSVYPAVQNAAKTQPVFMSHGELDDVVPVAWGQATKDKLVEEGADVEFTLRDIGHWHDTVTLAKLQDWIVATYEKIWEDEG